MVMQLTLATAELAIVCGGAIAPIADFGRCGPADKWSFLGDVYTPQCAAHDASVRGVLATGASKVQAHLQSLPLLPAAIGSYVRTVLRR
jgi:hypothetical protein